MEFQRLDDPEQLKAIEKPVIVKFATTWCGWCRRLNRELNGLEPELSETYRWFDVDTDERPDLARRFRIRTVPTMILFERGVPSDRSEGVYDYEIRPFLERHVS